MVYSSCCRQIPDGGAVGEAVRPLQCSLNSKNAPIRGFHDYIQGQLSATGVPAATSCVDTQGGNLGMFEQRRSHQRPSKAVNFQKAMMSLWVKEASLI